jgi:hypothetical protein
VSPVRYELGFLSQKTAFFIVTAVKTSNLTSPLLVMKTLVLLDIAKCSRLDIDSRFRETRLAF